MAAIVLLLFAVLVCARLGHNALWDDEADTALFAHGVWRTGDTTAIHGDNLVLYRDAVSIDPELRNRLVAPLQYYVCAAFLMDSDEPWRARLPFALAGIGAVALLLHWLVTLAATRRVWALSVLALLGNVSLLLYVRQARYYGLAILFVVIAAYAYAHRERGRSSAIALCLSLAGLCATHYLCYAGLCTALLVDYLVWGRRTAPLRWTTILAIIAGQIVICAPIALTWWPLGREIAPDPANGVVERLSLWLRTLRDMNNCEYGVGVLILVAPALSRRAKDPVLLRLPLAILVATLVVTAFSPQPAAARLADIRYHAFLIPACIVLGVRVLEAVPLRGALSMLVGVIAFQTTVLHAALGRLHPSHKYTVPVRNTLVSFIDELVHPPPSAYRMTAEWLGTHARPGDTAIVVPDFAAYPLMFHRPELVYGWQLSEKRARELPAIPAIQVEGLVAPNWIIDFDTPDLDQKMVDTLSGLGAAYRRFAALPVTFVDQTRPELFWHRFDADDAYDPKAPVMIWKRTRP